MAMPSSGLDTDDSSRSQIADPDPVSLRQRVAAALDSMITGVRRFQVAARSHAGPLLPDLHDYAVRVMQPGTVSGEACRIQEEFVHDAIACNPGWFRGFNPKNPGLLQGDVPFRVTDQGCTVEMRRVYMPPDVNTLLCVTDHCLRSRHVPNVIVAGRRPLLQWLDMDAAIDHCAAGIGIWRWASTDDGGEPDVVMGCCGDVPTLETLAAVDLLRWFFPSLKIRVVNVVDLMTLQSPIDHPHGLSDAQFAALFPHDKPVIFAFHGYAALIYRLTRRRAHLGKLQVRGYREEGLITTPFDRTVQYEIDRFHLAREVIACLPSLRDCAADACHFIRNRLTEHQRFVAESGKDLPYIRNWTWSSGLSAQYDGCEDLELQSSIGQRRGRVDLAG